MNLLTQSDAYLLNPSLGSLHKESIIWLEELDFWKDELEFLYRILSKRLPTSAFPQEQLAKMQRELINILTSAIGNLREKIRAHEQSLFPLLQKIGSSDEKMFRTEHQKLFQETLKAMDRVKRFKLEVFSLF